MAKSSKEQHDSHGSTPAGWTLTILVILGSLITAVGYCITNYPAIITGVIVIAIGLISGPVLKLMGLGVKKDS